MIHQVSPVATKTAPLPALNKALLQARHVQTNIKERFHTSALPTHGVLWSPLTAGPFIVPVTRWIE